MNHDWYQHYPEDVPKTIDFSKLPSTIAHTFTETCDKFSDKIAITSMGASISYRQLDRLSDRFASFLQNDLKLKKGDRFAIMLPNIIQFPVAFMGAQKAGCVLIALNPLYTPREMEHIFSDSGAKAVIILDLFLDKLEKIISKTKIEAVIATGIGDQLPFLKKLVITTILRATGKIPSHGLSVYKFKNCIDAGAKNKVNTPAISHDDLAILQYTGGTTGFPKAAMLTQRNILANMVQVRTWAHSIIEEGNENVLTALPLYHIFALSVNFLAFLSLGCRMLLIPKPIPISNTVKMFKKYNINVMTGVNTLYNALNNDEEFKKLAPKTIKFALAGGMALQDSVSKAWQQITGVRVTEGFGLTEASPVTHCNPLLVDTPVGSCGLPLPSTTAKIVDTEGNELPIGEEGELIVQGPQVMKGYWDKPVETKETLRDGWLWTGDIAKRDKDGYFYIVDRKKDMILVSGFNVYPNEIEEVLATHPKILEAAVIGLKDDKSGEAVKAFIVKNDESITEEEVRKFASENLTNYKRPKFIEFRKDLPKTNVGKILRRELREN